MKTTPIRVVLRSGLFKNIIVHITCLRKVWKNDGSEIHESASDPVPSVLHVPHLELS